MKDLFGNDIKENTRGGGESVYHIIRHLDSDVARTGRRGIRALSRMRGGSGLKDSKVLQR